MFWSVVSAEVLVDRKIDRRRVGEEFLDGCGFSYRLIGC